jgi:amidase
MERHHSQDNGSAALGDLAALDAVATAAAIAAGELSATEVTEAAIARIEAANSQLNAVVDCQFDEARAAVAAGLPAGPLRGVPVLLKDLNGEQAGHRSTMAVPALRDADVRATVDSAVARRLREAGAVILGRTNTPELATLPSTEPRSAGPTDNPAAPGHTPGGSSGGSAAAVAANLVPLAHGNDGGGSIRIPASCCGLVGLKPTRGRISLGPQRGEMWGGFVVEGVLTRTVRDTARGTDVLAGAEPGDPAPAPPLRRPLEAEVGADPGRLRIGLLDHSPLPDLLVDTATGDAARHTANLLADLGHEVLEAFPPDFRDPEYTNHFTTVLGVSLLRSVEQLGESVGRPVELDELEPFNQLLGAIGQGTSGSGYLASLDWLWAWSRRVARFWEPQANGGDGFDLLLSPTLGLVPPKLGILSDMTDPWAGLARVSSFIPYTTQFNVTGQPAISVPTFRSDGIPVGAQLAAAYAREDVLIRVAAQLEPHFT